jgi:hypothetical protein
MMFYQNSNDLVKNASSKSGHVQNSSETRRVLMNQVTSINDEVLNSSNNNNNEGTSLSIGTIFQNMVQTMINNVSLSEGMTSAGTLNNNEKGEGGGTFNQSQGLKSQVDQEKKYTKQEIDHIERTNSIVKLIDAGNDNFQTINNNGSLKEGMTSGSTSIRKSWAEVTDSEGITKYGYITRDGVFQIWHFPSSTSYNPNNWLETDKMSQNVSVIGCPSKSKTVQKITISGKWDDLKPYEMAYSSNDAEKANPLFMVINTGVRDEKNTPNRSGLFSCSNENKNIFVTQRPSADFQFKKHDTHDIGCYTIPTNLWNPEKDFENRGFTFQEDLFEASISQCKRRAEDLGSSYFMISAPEKGKPPNRGGCWIYTRSGKPNIDGILNYDANATKCHRVNNQEDGEDGFMQRYNTEDLKRLYGRENSYTDRSVALYVLKTGGPTGVDNEHQNGRGSIGRVAYVDYNGEKRNYPESTLSYVKPTATNPGTYINLGGYDTRSLEDSYSLTQITPGKANAAGNLLYRASRNGWNPAEWWRLCTDKGATYTRAILTDGRVLGSYNSKSWTYNGGWYWVHDKDSFVYDGTKKYYSTHGIWGDGNYAHLVSDNRYFPYFAGYDMIIWSQTLYTIAGAMHSTSDGKGELNSKKWQWEWNGHSLRDLETYQVDPNSFPQTNPPEYERKIRTMAVGQSISTTIEKCGEMCDGDEKCGGFVYTKGNAGSTGQCELKDRKKMYPMGLRTADPTKQLMLKVPIINSSIKDDECKGKNGKYRQVTTTQYAHYPYVGEMSGSSICDIKKLVPKKGTLNAQNPSSMITSVDTAFTDTNASITTYKRQMNSDKNKTKIIMYGPWISKDTEAETVTLDDGKIIYVIYDQEQTKMVSKEDKEEKYYVGKPTELNNEKWEQSATTSGGKFLIKVVAPSAPNSVEDVTQEGFVSYQDTMNGVQRDLEKIAKSEYQRERLLAISEETNKQLISESYKFILWSILAILVVLALIKLKEMFGQDDADEDDGDSGGGGFLATIMGLFSIGKVDTSDIADKTGDIKAGLASAGEEFMKASDELSTNITEGADNLVSSANDAATGAVESAKGLADTVSETATDAVNKVGDTVNGSGSETPPATTGGRRGKKK